MTKKEYKKKCKQEKTTSYKLMLSGAIVSSIGLIIIALSFFIIKEYMPQIIGFVVGGITAFIGMMLDLVGEIILSKNYKTYNK